MQSVKKEILSNAKKHLISDNGLVEERVGRVMHCVWRIIELSETARKEGLLALEEYVSDLKKDGSIFEDTFTRKLIELVVDGTDPEFVSSIAESKLEVLGLDTFEAYEGYLITEGCLCIQAGYNPMIIKEMLFAFMPDIVAHKIKDELFEKSEVLSDGMIDELYKNWEQREPIEIDTDNVIFGELLKKLKKYNDKEMQRILENVFTNVIFVVGMNCTLDDRKMFTRNMSRRLVAMIMLDYRYADCKDLNNAVEDFFKVIRKLEDSGEISDYGNPLSI